MNRKSRSGAPTAPAPPDPRLAPEAGFEPATPAAARRERVLRELAVLEASMARLAERHLLHRKRPNAPGSRSVH